MQLKSDFEHAQRELHLQENIAKQVGQEKDELKELLDQAQLENKKLLEENKKLQAGLEERRIESKDLLSQLKANLERTESCIRLQKVMDQEWDKLLDQEQAKNNGLLEEVEALRTELQKQKKQKKQTSSQNPQVSSRKRSPC